MLGTARVNWRVGAAYQSVLERIRRVGAIAIFAVTEHPIGLLTPAHLAGGLVGMSATHFAVAITLAAPLRSAAYAFLGSAALDMSTMQSLTMAMIAVFFACAVQSAGAQLDHGSCGDRSRPFSRSIIQN